jgi:hypothetical protein
MLKYILVKVPIEEIERFPKVVEEMLAAGWSLAGSLLCEFSTGDLIQPMTRETHTPGEWFAKRRK